MYPQSVFGAKILKITIFHFTDEIFIFLLLTKISVYCMGKFSQCQEQIRGKIQNNGDICCHFNMHSSILEKKNILSYI